LPATAAAADAEHAALPATAAAAAACCASCCTAIDSRGSKRVQMSPSMMLLPYTSIVLAAYAGAALATMGNMACTAASACCNWETGTAAEKGITVHVMTAH
jgi:hypothetical protein